MIKKVHVVPHSHWDREWYFTTSRSKLYLMHNLQKVLALLSADKGYAHFVLDGQASLLDDYLAWRPEDQATIEKLVKAGKLIVGPWYTQTDQLVISGESIVRNMQYGMAISDAVGGYMPVGYVPDSFGQSAAMPQIYREFEIEDTLFWRGVSDDDVKHTEYTWRGEDGSVVNVYQIPSGYYIGGDIPENDGLSQFLKEDPFKTVWDRSTTDQVLFPNGFDQAPARENLSELVAKMNAAYDEFDLEISTFEAYINSIKAQHPQLEQVSGELLNGKMMRIHKSIFSSRPDLKKLNTEVQNYLINKLEPILSMSTSLGFDYPTEVVKEIWKLMFENAAHDSIGSCVSDTTNEDIYLRYKKAKDLAENLVELKLRELVMHMDNKADITLTAFNTASQAMSGVFETTLYVPQLDFAIEDGSGNAYPYTILSAIDQTDYVLGQGNVLDGSKAQFRPVRVYKVEIAIALADVNAFGYQQFHLNLGKVTHQPLEKSLDTCIENAFYKIQVNKGNSVDILDKKLNIWYKDQAILEENGDDGDSFNYSPPRQDSVIRSTEFSPEITVDKSDIISTLVLSYRMQVPENLSARASGENDVTLPVSLTIKLKQNTAFIDFSCSVDNRHADSHRLCVLFDTAIASKFSYADQQFGVLKRPVVREHDMALWEADQASWNEVPIAIETCQSFVSLENEARGVALVPKAVREYEIVGDAYDTIRLTLFRTYGVMGKADLLYRPGRASGESVIETPDAQLHQKITYDFSVVYYQGSLSDYALSNQVNHYLKGLELYQYAEYLNTRLRFTQFDVEKYLPLSNSLFETTGDLVLSTVKKAENRDGLILRYYNGNYQTPETIKIKVNQAVKLAELVNLKEETKQDLSVSSDCIVIPEVGHAKFISLYIEFE
ncbi:MAG: mannosylglycerate hydrolase [Lactococcus sp.]|nr:mannosylglycerate hydrolase [Lactococcus sp.]